MVGSFSSNPYAAYGAASQTAPKTRQIVMLYEGIIRFLQQAREASQEKKIDERYNKLTKASDVIVGLQGSLDFESGGEQAEILYEYYSQIYRTITDAHHADAKDVSHIEKAIAELKEMRDVWDEIDRGDNAVKTAETKAETPADSAEPTPQA